VGCDGGFFCSLDVFPATRGRLEKCRPGEDVHEHWLGKSDPTPQNFRHVVERSFFVYPNLLDVALYPDDPIQENPKLPSGALTRKNVANSSKELATLGRDAETGAHRLAWRQRDAHQTQKPCSCSLRRSNKNPVWTR
jgi:hypothetical protein